MWIRREVVLGGALTLLWGTGCGCGVRAAQPRRGCVLHEEEARLLLRGGVQELGFRGGAARRPEEDVRRRSGDRDFDAALARTLSRMVDVFGVLPGFAYTLEPAEANAWAMSRAVLENPDGTILFGLRLLRELMSRPEHPEVAVAAICAHEFGHILQFRRGLIPLLTRGQASNRRVELQADFFAGYFAGVRRRERPEFPAAVFAVTQHGSGDFASDHPDHHGTPDERAAAVVRGFEVAFRERRPLSEAVEMGLNYVLRL